MSIGDTADDLPSTVNIRKYPIIVATAQIVINWIKRKQFRLEDCSLLVFDEVHNASKAHPYVIILKEFYAKLDSLYKPLFLGLTASPMHGEIVQMHLGLQDLCNTCQAKVCMPCIYWEDLLRQINRPRINFSVVEVSEEMKFLDQQIVKLCGFFSKRIQMFLDMESSFILFPGIDNLNGARGFIRTISDKAHQINHVEAMQMSLLLSQLFSAVEINSVLGPKSARLYLSEVLNTAIHKKERGLATEDKEEIDTFLEMIRSLESTSNKLQTLLNLLLSIPDEEASKSRVIIFVQTKRAARQIFQILKANETINNRWLPAIFVGQSAGQVDGMSYFEDQAPTLARFRLGQHRLLLSTNVLQEGMDVPICNRVILFDQSWSLTSFIQSRGRARASESAYDLICSSEEQKKYENLISSEKTMEDTMMRVMFVERTLSLKTVMLIMHIKLEVDHMSNWVTRENSVLEIGEQIANPAQMAFSKGLHSIRFVKFLFYYLFDQITAETIESSLAQLPLVNLKFNTSTSENIFNMALIEMTAEISSLTPFSPADFYKLLRHVIGSISDFNHRVLSYKLLGIPKIPCNDMYLAVADSFDIGNLLNPNQFAVAESITTPVKFGIMFNQGVIRAFHITKDNRCYRMDIVFSSVDKFVMVDVEGSRVSIAIPLRRPPHLFYANTEYCLDVKLSNLDLLAWERSSPEEFKDFIDVTECAAVKLDMFVKGLEKDQLMAALQRLKGVDDIEEVCFGPIELVMEHGRLTSSQILECLNYFSGDFDLVYILHTFFSSCFSSTCMRVTPGFFEILNLINPALRKHQITQITIRSMDRRFVDLELEMALHIHEGTVMQVEKSHPAGTTPIRIVTVTPSKIIYELPKDMTCNRILREFDPDFFIRVHFRDEDKLKLSSVKSEASLKNLLLRVEHVLQNGLNIGGRHYEFLAMSASQLRDHGCWFVAAHFREDGVKIDANFIRSWCGDFEAIKNVAKHVARLGQSLSASQDTVTVPSYDFEMIPDITVVSPRAADGTLKKYTFTDGIGMISPALADEVASKLQLSPRPSAFQIRFSGFKGTSL